MMRKTTHIVLLAGLISLLSGCSNLMFFPSRQWAMVPDQRGYAYEDVAISTGNGALLSAWLLPQRVPDLDKPRGAVIFFHGNAQNISTHIANVYWLTDEGYDVLLVDYRGYGKSDGDATLSNSLQDIRSSVAWFLRRYPGSTPKYLLAQSLGASMAGYVIATEPALRRPFSAIVLDSGFTRYRRITREALSRSWLTWALQYPASWTMPDRYDLIDHIAEISPTPLLIVHGREDTVVPFAHSVALYAAAHEPKAKLNYEGNHISAYYNQKNRIKLLKFLQSHTSPPAMPDSPAR